MPLQRRVPKFGFTNINRVEYKPINLSTIQGLLDADKKVKKIDPEYLISKGLAGKNDLVKVLNKGELTANVEVTAHAFSKSAVAAIEAVGGNAVKL